LQRDALQTAISDFGGDVAGATADVTADDGDDALSKMSTLLNALVGSYSGLIPAIPGTGEQVVALRQTVTSIGLVQARQASFVNRLIGDPSFPDTFEPALTQDELAAVVADLED